MRMLYILFLGICMIHDIDNKKIPAIWIWSCLGIATGYKLCMIIYGKSSVEECLLCILPGIILLIFSYMSGQVGSGDGWLITAGGLLLEWEELIEQLCYSFVAAGLFSACCMLVVHKKRKDRIPFVPFLFLGSICMIWRKAL